VERQRAEIISWAASHDLIIPRWFFDPARSGRSTAGRDQFLQLIQYLSAEKRPEKGVVFWEYARLARDFDDTMYYLADLRRQGYVAWSITDAIPDTLEGRLLESIIAWKNAKYLQDLSRAIRSGQRFVISAHQGYPQRRAPMGYRKEPIQIGTRRDGRPHIVSRLVLDPDIAPLMVEAFQMRASGATYAEIHNAMHLTASHISLGRMMSNPIYIGTLRYGGREFPNFCPPLVDQDLWDATQTVNRERRSRYGYNHPRVVRSRFVLTGLLFCSECKSPMHARIVQQPGRRAYEYYRCCNTANGRARACTAPMLPKSQIEEWVYDRLETVILRPDVITPLLDEVLAELPEQEEEHRAQIAHLEKQQNETQRSIQNILKALAEAGHSRAMLAKLADLEKKRDELAASLASAASHIPAPIEMSPEVITSAIRHMTAKLRQGTRESLTVLRGLVVEVRAKRKGGGSHYSHRAQPIQGTITVRLPLLESTHTVSL
jgi:site-specific DNA recombinase